MFEFMFLASMMILLKFSWWVCLVCLKVSRELVIRGCLNLLLKLEVLLEVLIRIFIGVW